MTSFVPCLICMPGERTQTWKAVEGISGLIGISDVTRALTAG